MGDFMLTIVIIVTIIVVGDIYMLRRITFAAASVASLMIGAIIYVLFRPNSYIAIFVDGIMDMGTLRQFLESSSTDFLKFYFPDFLWTLSLCFCLYAVFGLTKKRIIFFSLVAFFCSVAWEIIQWFSIVSGTGDIIDVIMYLLAGICAASLGLKKEKLK